MTATAARSGRAWTARRREVERGRASGRATRGPGRGRGERDDGDRDVDEEDPVPVGVLDEPAARDRAERDAEARDGRPRRRSPAPRSSAGNTAVRIDSVDGMISAPPMPMSARPAMSCAASPDSARATEPSAEDDQPGGQGALAAEAVAEAAGGQQQPGEHEHVGVDDPLQLARGWRRDRRATWAGRR